MRTCLVPTLFDLLLLTLLTARVAGQQPVTLRHSIPAPLTIGEESQAGFGQSVAVEGGFIAIGVPRADVGDYDSGVVKVFDSATGVLLHVLANPSPRTDDYFGNRIAISGTRLVVGAYADETGANEAGSVYIYDLSSAAPTAPVLTLNNPNPASGDRFGFSVAISGTRVAVGAYQDDPGGVVNAGSVYIYDLGGVVPAVPVAALNNPGPAVDDQFGYSVGISGTRVVVGALADDTGASNAGSAYVYELSSATPTVPVRTLNNPSPATNDIFGLSVAIAGTRVVVGAPFHDTGATNAGSAFVYDLSSATPTVPVATLNNPGPEMGESFGQSVAIFGTRLVVGAHFENTGAAGAGSAYVYDLSGATPTVPVFTLNNPDAVAGEHFGVAVAISGARVVVGTPARDPGGIAFAYDLNGATPTVPVNTLRNPGPVVGDSFGYSVAISGTRVVVGAVSDDTGVVDSGSAYVYDLTSGTPTVPVAALHNPNPVRDDSYGTAVAISGTRVVVGASGDGTSEGDMGSIYVYDLSSATPSVPVLSVDNPGLLGSHLFGIAVAISGTRIVVGASYDDTGALGAGIAYVYDLSSATPAVPAATLLNPNPAPFDEFGNSVGISGTRIVVGVHRSDIGGTDSGRTYVFDLSSASPDVPVRTLNNPSPASGDEFGYAVAISGARVVVGSVLDDTGQVDAGSAYVYDLSSATPAVPVATLNNPSPAANDLFGRAVSISGTRVLVGAFRDDIGGTDSGSAYLYDLTSNTPTVPVATLNNPEPAAGDFFGGAVAIDGTTMIVGANADDTLALDAGQARIFGSSLTDEDGDGLLDSWEIAHFGSTVGQSALDDSDHDGRAELLEEAFETDPLVADAPSAPAVVNEGGYLTLTIPKHLGVTYLVQSADKPDPAAFSTAATTVLLNDATTLKVRDNVLIGTAPIRFLRVQVTAAP
jgi:sulfur relay (sulfurtransferase) DsrC/TusE family protein